MKYIILILLLSFSFVGTYAQFAEVDTSSTIVDTLSSEVDTLSAVDVDTVVIDTTTAQYIRYKAVQDSIANEKVYEGAQHAAEFPGGGPAFRYFIEKNMSYPPLAKANNIEGKVFVTFVVDKKGVVKHPVIHKSLGYGCDEEAIRLVKKMPKWKPGIWYDDNPVHTKVTMSIPFVLPK